MGTLKGICFGMVNKYLKSIANNKNSDGNSKKSGFDKDEREEMIVKYAYLVNYVANRMARRLPPSVIKDELVSAGCLGLIDAVDKYDASKNVNFKTYAQHRIKGAILDELRNMDWYSRSMRKKIQNIEKAVRVVETRHKRSSDENEVAEELGVTLEQYHKMLTEIHAASLLSLDAFIRNSNTNSSSTSTFQDNLHSSDDPADNIMMGELKLVLAKAVKSLGKKEQIVISLYYYEELTLKEIGNVLDLTESRICQIHTMSLIKLKARLQTYKQHK